eukprot:6188289-Pleurochrysis_carterae.AAC.1
MRSRGDVELLVEHVPPDARVRLERQPADLPRGEDARVHGKHVQQARTHARARATTHAHGAGRNVQRDRKNERNIIREEEMREQTMQKGRKRARESRRLRSQAGLNLDISSLCMPPHDHRHGTRPARRLA